MANGIVQLPFLGDPAMGRWGNQLFIIAFAKAYADSIGAVLELPDTWIGRIIFPHFENYPTISTILPVMNFHHMPKGETNIALTGFYQNQESIDLWKNKPYREWFKIRESLMAPHKEVWRFITEHYGTMPICHIRSGDYKETPYPILSQKTFIKAIKKYVSDDYDDIQWAFVSDGETSEPQLPQLLKETPLDFMSDFIYMMLAPILFRGNSSFSWWAATLANAEQKVYSPLVQGLNKNDTECEFVEGNWPSFLPHDDHHTDLRL